MVMTEKDLVVRMIASILDSPSVYMGGPSVNNMRRAEKIVKYLIKSKRLVDSQCDHSEYKDYKSNGIYCPMCDQIIKIIENND